MGAEEQISIQSGRNELLGQPVGREGRLLCRRSTGSLAFEEPLARPRTLGI